MNEDGLIAEARRGTLAAFEVLVRTHQGAVRGFLRRLAGDPAVADDLAQDVFVVAWRKLDAFEARGTFRGWLCRIAYTTFLQDRRASAARDRAALASTSFASGAAHPTEGRLDLERAMDRLNVEQRAALTLCYGEGMSHAEAADVLGLPLGTVKSHVSRGRERLVAMLGDGRAA